MVISTATAPAQRLNAGEFYGARVQLALLLAAIHPPTLHALMWPLVFGGVSIAIYGLIAVNQPVTLYSLHNKNTADANKPTKTFSVKTALILAAVIAVALIASAALKA